MCLNPATEKVSTYIHEYIHITPAALPKVPYWAAARTCLASEKLPG